MCCANCLLLISKVLTQLRGNASSISVCEIASTSAPVSGSQAKVVVCRIIFFWDRTLFVRDVLRKTFTATQQIDRCQNFDTTNKSSDVSVGNCDHFLQGNLQKSSLNLQGRMKSRAITFIAIA